RNGRRAGRHGGRQPDPGPRLHVQPALRRSRRPYLGTVLDGPGGDRRLSRTGKGKGSMSGKTMTRTGWVLSGLFILFMLGASVAPKLLRMPVAEETLTGLGWQPGNAFWIGIVELA